MHMYVSLSFANFQANILESPKTCTIIHYPSIISLHGRQQHSTSYFKSALSRHYFAVDFS